MELTFLEYSFTGGSNVTSPTGTLQSDRMQYQTQYNQYQTQTLPHNVQTVSQSSYESRTLPHQSSYQQQVSQPKKVKKILEYQNLYIHMC